MRILLIDDSPDIGAIVKISLRPYDVEQAFTLSEGREALAKFVYDLAIIDVNLPDGSGFEICSETSNNPDHTQLPLIMLSGRAETSDKVFGLNCGAVDYLTKPFESSELKARVDSQIRRQKSLNRASVTNPYFELDLGFQRCFVTENGAKKNVNVTPTEFRILKILTENHERVLTREEIAQAIWSTQGITVERKGLDTHVSHLRRKMGPAGELIVAVYGKGYALQFPHA